MQTSTPTSQAALSALLVQLHERSEAELLARARAQYPGTDETFRELAGQYAALAPRMKGRFLQAHGLSTEDTDAAQGTALSLAVSAPMGDFLRNMTLARQAGRVLELGSSCGVSTLYFADALRWLGRGTVVATERDGAKCAQLRRHVEMAGLARHVELCEGDVFHTVEALEGHFDLVFLDVWASGYLELFRRVERLLRPGSVVLADNMYTAEDAVRSFKRYVDAHPGLSSTTLDFESGVEFIVAL